MRLSSASLAGSIATAAVLALLAHFTAHPSAAEPTAPAAPQPCTCPPLPRACICPAPDKALPATRPRTRLASHSPKPDESDEIAALAAIGHALREVGDGSSYVWHRHHGRLSGVVQPTVSFKDASGRICRHIVVMLATHTRTGRVEGIACRLADGNWQLEG